MFKIYQQMLVILLSIGLGGMITNWASDQPDTYGLRTPLFIVTPLMIVGLSTQVVKKD